MAWRDTGRPARFWVMDYRSAFPLLLFFLHIEWWTLWTAIAGMVVFWFIERKGFTFPVFFRWVRSRMAGKKRFGMPRRHARKLY